MLVNGGAQEIWDQKKFSCTTSVARIIKEVQKSVKGHTWS
jgi:hypothetical protein